MRLVERRDSSLSMKSRGYSTKYYFVLQVKVAERSNLMYRKFESVHPKIELEDFCPFSRLNLPMFCRTINQYGLFVMKVILQIYLYVNTLGNSMLLSHRDRWK